MLPWTDSAEVMDQVDVLKAQASIENLTAMRESLTDWRRARLGNVTPDELKIASRQIRAAQPEQSVL